MGGPAAGGMDRLGALAWAEMVLRDQEMPPDELRVILTTPDRELVRHHLELHLERLEEWLSNQRRRVAAVERIVAEAIGRPRPARSRRPRSRSFTRLSTSRPVGRGIGTGGARAHVGKPS